MLYFKISNPSGRLKLVGAPASENSGGSFLSKQEILNRHLNKCYMKVGDRIALKKPKRPRIRGTLLHAEDDANKVVWQGNQPKFLTVELDVIDKTTGIITCEKRNVGVKQLIFTAG